jgi:hypothetical protein
MHTTLITDINYAIRHTDTRYIKAWCHPTCMPIQPEVKWWMSDMCGSAGPGFVGSIHS